MAAQCSPIPVFYIIDLGNLPKVEGVDCDGLVGYEMFRRFGVTIDYAEHELTLADPAKFAPPAGAAAVPFELDDRIPIVAGTLDGVPVRISVDTGSRSSLTMHSPFVREHDLVDAVSRGARSGHRLGRRRSVAWPAGALRHARARRSSDIAGIAGDLYTGDKGSFANPDLAGNLGGGVLRRFTVAFDYANKKMYLAPNAELRANPMRSIAAACSCSATATHSSWPMSRRRARRRAPACAANDRIVAIDGERSADVARRVAREAARSAGRDEAADRVAVRDGNGTVVLIELVARTRIAPSAGRQVRINRCVEPRAAGIPAFAGTTKAKRRAWRYSTRQNTAFRYRDSGTCARNG